MTESKVSRRRLLQGGAASILAGTTLATSAPAEARPLFLGSAAVPSGGTTTLTSFQLQEHSGQSSIGYKRVGMVFAPGQVPAGARLRVVGVRSQFDQRSTYPDGSLRCCSCCVADDTPFAAGETRTYQVVRETGAWNNTNAMTVATALAGTDFRLAFTSLSGSVTGAQPDHVAVMADILAVPTRMEKYENGPVCVSWYGWGMAVNGTTPHSQLKCYVYMSVWLDASGNPLFYEPTFVPSLDWWTGSEINTNYQKENLVYTATLKNGTTTLETYRGAFNASGVRAETVVHPYRARWATVRLADDLEHGARHTVGVARPTLLYLPNRDDWYASGVVQRIDTSTAYTMPTDYTGTYSGEGQTYKPNYYQPPTGQMHRTVLGATALYAGRGIYDNVAAIAWGNPTAANMRTMRIGALVALHLPMHFVTGKTRQRPSFGVNPADATPDIASSIYSLIMWDQRSSSTPSSYYDFTADGMPAAAHAYTDELGGFRGTVATRDGYVAPAGSALTLAFSATANWSMEADTSHYYSPAKFAYQYTGERYYFDATLSLGMNCCQMLMGGVGTSTNGMNGAMPPTMGWNTYGGAAIFPGAVINQWAAICTHDNAPLQFREVQWALNAVIGLAVIADDRVEKGFVRQYVAHHAKYLNKCAGEAVASGSVGAWSGNSGVEDPWNTFTMGPIAYMAYDITQDANWLPVAEFGTKAAITFVSPRNQCGMANAYFVFTKNKQTTGGADSGVWNATTNPWLPHWYEANEESDSVPCSLVGSTGEFTQTISSPKYSWAYYDWAADDPVIVNNTRYQGLSVVAPPPELSPGTVYYMRDIVLVGTTARKFKLCATPGGPAITYSTDYPHVALGYSPTASGALPVQATAYINFVMSSYFSLAHQAFKAGYNHSHPEITQELMDIYDGFFYYYKTYAYDRANWAATVTI